MFAARQRAGCVARQLQRTARTYASDAHGHSHGHGHAEVNESFGKGSIYTAVAFFGSVLVYQFVPAEGEQSSIMNLIERWSSKGKDWEEINALHTKAAQQAGFDRNLFENGGTGQQRYVDVAYPEAMQSHAARNIRAGHMNNIDHVVEHFRQQHVKEEERKANKLASQ